MTERARLEQEAVAFAQALIRIESVNTGGGTVGDGEARAAAFVAERLAEVGLVPEVIEAVAGRPNVIARIAGRDRDAGALVVHAHLDVVPVDGQDWTHPPFGAEIHDGLLYGRGAVDMKGFAGVVLAVARAIAAGGRPPRRDLVIAFLADEEAGGVAGAHWLVRHRPDVFAGATEAIGEVGGFSVPIGDRRAYLVATGEKGVASVTLVARGRAGHGSRPTHDNAVVRLARAVVALADHEFPLAVSPALDAFLAVADAIVGADRTATVDTRLASLGRTGGLIAAGARTTVSSTMLEAGTKRNVIPAKAVAELDVRFAAGQERTLVAELQAVVGDDVEVVLRGATPAIESPVDGPLVEVLRAAVAAEDPDGLVVPFQLSASTDHKHLARLGIRGYGFTPLRVTDELDVFDQFHAADEHVPVDALRFCAVVTERILREA